jgi:NAD(P)-dependent dehydrogenase (short-subunit alcohol dehydrogenase family)
MNNYVPAVGILNDRIILVTGAGGGLGRSVARALASYGATIILLGRTTHKLEKVYDEIEQAGHPLPAIYPMNLEGATQKDYLDLAAVVEKEFGHLDGIVHNAAIYGQVSELQSLDIETWYKVMQVNLNAPFMLTQACLPMLKKSNDASIVFVTDNKNRAYWGAYGASKAGLNSFMKIVADELETNTTVRANSFDPGPLRTNMRINTYPGENPQEMPDPDSVTPAFIYLLGPDSTGTTGQQLTAQDFTPVAG